MAGTYRSRDNGIKDSFHYASGRAGYAVTHKKQDKKKEEERLNRESASRKRAYKDQLEFEQKRQDIKTKASAERTYKNTLAKKYATDKYKEAKKQASGEVREVKNNKSTTSKKGSKKK